MTVVLVSNYLNHHMLQLCRALVEETGDNFTFIATRTMKEERRRLGYREENELHDFVLCAYKSQEHKNRAMELCAQCDVLVFGSAPEEYLKERLKHNKLTFRYSERVYKKPCPWYELPARAVKYYFKHTRHKNMYLLCASAYTAGDYAKTGTYLNRTYKWGYFPPTAHYDDIDRLIEGKKANRILWVGRMLDWKHPEAPVEVARRLAEQGRDFHLDMIGTGPMEDEIRELVARYGLGDRVTLLGSKTPDEVRAYMERASIYLFTSDRGEGWGAVLNESMNSGCAVVASHAIGSAPFLLRDGVNGCLYADGDTDMLYSKVARLLDEPERCRALGRAAYRTITEEWNANHAAERLLALSKAILGGEDAGQLFESGPCSRASVLPESG